MPSKNTGNSSGWIKLYRSIIEKGWLKNPKLLAVWFYCLLKASHKQHKVLVGRQEVILQPGQFIFGRHVAAGELNMPPSTVYQIMRSLVSRGNIGIKASNKFSVVTVTNWEAYQSGGKEGWQENEQQMNNKRTATEHKQEGREEKEKKENSNASGRASRKPVSFAEDSVGMKLAALLFSLIRRNNPQARQPWLQTWAREIDRMLRIDGRSEADIEGVMRWAQADDFWCTVVLSAEKLREHYDQLTMKMKAEEKQHGKHSNHYGTGEKFNGR